MRRTTDETLRSTTDRADPHVQSALEGIVGKRCWQVRLGYGGELHLHLGTRIPYRNPKMASLKQGSWRFGTCGSSWRITTPVEAVSSEDQDGDFVEKNLAKLENTRIHSFEVKGVSLTIVFSNQCRLKVTPSNGDRDDLPYWELFMPRHRYLAFGKGNVWYYGRSDVPNQARNLAG